MDRCTEGNRLCKGRTICDKEDESGIHCTRDSGHSGDHVACGLDRHNLSVWPQEQPGPCGLDDRMRAKAPEMYAALDWALMAINNRDTVAHWEGVTKAITDLLNSIEKGA